jgi:hypothetical protein
MAPSDHLPVRPKWLLRVLPRFNDYLEKHIEERVRADRVGFLTQRPGIACTLFIWSLYWFVKSAACLMLIERSKVSERMPCADRSYHCATSCA